MGKRTTIILNDKLFTKLLKIQTEKILERNASVSISSLINDMVGEKIQEINTKKAKPKIDKHNAILEKISDMENYDHLAFTIHNDEDFGVQLTEFVLQGLKMNFLNVLSLSERDAQKYVQILQENGINAFDLINSEDLVILSHEEIFDKANFGEIKPILKKMNKVTSLAKSKKKSGINVLGTIAGTLAITGKHNECISLEKVWHESIPKFEIPIRVVCPYYPQVAPEIVDSLVLNHTDDFIR